MSLTKNNYNNPITIGIVAGEISGDILGAGLIQELKKHLPNAHFVGIAGPHMKKTGMHTWYKMDELTTMGIAEVIIRLPKILWILYDVARRFLSEKLDIFIGIDLPDFNLILEKYLKNKGIYTIHYVSPTIWAWRTQRTLQVAKSTNNLLVLLPFEKKFYDHYNIPCQFIGHPLADIIPLHPNKLSARRKLGIPNNVLCLVLLPGSRKNEVKRLIHDFIACAKLLSHEFPGINILLPIADKKLNKYFQNIDSKSIILHILNKQSTQAMIAADVALVASGTATLECMLAKCPMVVAYRMHPITCMLAKYFVKIPWISLPNILSGQELVKEFIQNNCTSTKLANAVIDLLKNDNQRLMLQNAFQKLHKNIQCNANKQAAYTILQALN